MRYFVLYNCSCALKNNRPANSVLVFHSPFHHQVFREKACVAASCVKIHGPGHTERAREHASDGHIASVCRELFPSSPDSSAPVE